jgi:hypothetical protein
METATETSNQKKLPKVKMTKSRLRLAYETKNPPTPPTCPDDVGALKVEDCVCQKMVKV